MNNKNAHPRPRRPRQAAVGLVVPAAAAIFLLAGVLPAAPAWAGPEIPGARQRRPVALVRGVVHPISAGPIRAGTVLFQEGRIVAVGTEVDLPAGTREIDCTGKHVYPGLFNACGVLGLLEIGAVRATRDTRETGSINPNVRAEVAVNPDSALIPVTRSGGVLLNLTAPVGGLISGTSAVLQLDGWTWEDMTLSAPAAMHVTWPRMRPDSNWWEEDDEEKPSERQEDRLEPLRRALADGRAYLRRREHDPAAPEDRRWEAMRPLLAGDLPMVVAADTAEQIQSAVALATEQRLRLVIYGGYEAADCARLLRSRNVPVIVGGVYRLPLHRHDAYDAPFTLPERLRQAGVPFCIAADTRSDASNTRNLPYHAAMATAFGLPRDVALKAITLFPARIFGVADRVGSLEPGKDATLIVTSGDPLEAGSCVEQAFIQGRPVDLTDRHKRLWRKYQEKLRRR
jgi:imidazolonepropionase-like amidohydrolase